MVPARRDLSCDEWFLRDCFIDLPMEFRPSGYFKNGPLVDERVLLSEFVWREVVEARMRPHFIVMAAPRFNDHLRFASATEPLEAQALVAEAAVEAFVHTVLPRLARIDQRRL